MRLTKNVLIFAIAAGAAVGAAQGYTRPSNSGFVSGPLGRVAMDRVAAKMGIRLGDQLVVTVEGGGVAVYDRQGGFPTAAWSTETKVTSLQASEGFICWIQDKDRGVYVAKPGDAKPYRIDVPQYAMRSLPTRLSPWAHGVLVHGATDFGFIDLRQKMAHSPNEILSSDIIRTVRQGIVTSSWDGKNGMLVSIRRYGTRKNAGNGTRDIGLMTAWSTSEDSSPKLLGGYTCSLVDFEAADGPKVQVKMGNRVIERPFGTGVIGNIVLGPEGVVGLGKGEAVVVPFYTDNWMPNRLDTSFRPNLAQNATYFGNNAWWADGRRVYRLDLTDGSGEAYIPKQADEEARAVIADTDGAYVLTNRGIRHIESEIPSPAYAMVAADAGADATSLETMRLKDFAMRATRGDRMPDGSRATIKGILKACGLRRDGEKQVDEAKIGDEIITADRDEIYLGNGEVLSIQAGTLAVRGFEPGADTRIYRVLAESPIPVPAPAPAPRPTPVQPRPRPVPSPRNQPINPPVVPTNNLSGMGARLSDITSVVGRILPLGVNRPNPTLGTTAFVRANPNAPYDRPQSAQDHQLLAIAQGWLGVPYRWGGNTKSGVDCSGFVTAVFREMGIRLPRHSQDIGQVKFGTVVQDELHFGDVLVYQRPRHVALYIGNGQTIEAVSGGVGYSSIRHRTQAIVRRFL